MLNIKEKKKYKGNEKTAGEQDTITEHTARMYAAALYIEVWNAFKTFKSVKALFDDTVSLT